MGGLYYEEARDCLVALAKRDNLVALDVVEVAPPYDSSEITIQLAAKLIIDVLSTKFPSRPAGAAAGGAITMRTVFTNATLLDATRRRRRAPAWRCWLPRGASPGSGRRPRRSLRRARAVVDLGGNTLMPGLIDVHMHITQGAVPDPIAEFTETVPFMALRGAAQAAILLDSGYTTMRNLGAFGYSDVAIREAVNQGLARGPRMLVSGEMVITEGSGERGYLRPEVNIPESGMFVGVEEARRAVRRQVYNGADVIKLIASGRVGSNAYSMPWDTELTQEEMTAVCDEAHRWGKRVAAHAYSAQSVAMCAIAGVDSIEHGALVDEPTIAPDGRARGVTGAHDDSFSLVSRRGRGRALPGLPACPGPANGPAPAGPLPGVHGLRAEYSHRLRMARARGGRRERRRWRCGYW